MNIMHRILMRSASYSIFLCLSWIHKHLNSIFIKVIILLIHIVAPSLMYWITYFSSKREGDYIFENHMCLHKYPFKLKKKLISKNPLIALLNLFSDSVQCSEIIV